LRTETSDRPGTLGRVTTAIGEEGGDIGAIDIVRVGGGKMIRDLTVAARDEAHADAIVSRVKGHDGVQVLHVTDRTFLVHLGGKIEINSRVPVRGRDDLSMIYTPGVARICLAIRDDPASQWNLTVKRHMVAVVSDGSAVLGLGNIGPAAALPVMEGKAALFKRFGGVDAWPVVLDTQDTDEIVAIVKAIAPAYGGINLEDIAAPRCFEIEMRLRELLDIPVFHDDQHGTAIVVLAALTNALRCVSKSRSDVRIVMSGAGAAGTAVLRLLIEAGARDVVVADIDGIVHRGRDGLEGDLQWIAEHTNEGGYTGTLKGALAGADVFIGVSAPNLLTGDDIASMADDSIVFALANPDPEVDPAVAREHATVVATGRSDFPNQINNVLAFPGVFRGLLDAHSREITSDLLLAAARALASTVADDELNVNYIVPSVFNPEVATAVAGAVQAAALEGAARRAGDGDGDGTPDSPAVVSSMSPPQPGIGD
jgi:malate dehydrogenase (oxaloacetate-decarboxylating)